MRGAEQQTDIAAARDANLTNHAAILANTWRSFRASQERTWQRDPAPGEPVSLSAVVRAPLPARGLTHCKTTRLPVKNNLREVAD